MKRVYVIGLPKIFDEETTTKLIRGADFCVVSPTGVMFSVGDMLKVKEVLNEGNKECPTVDKKFVVRALEAVGRVALVEEELYSSAYCGGCGELRSLFRNPRGAVARCGECLGKGAP